MMRGRVLFRSAAASHESPAQQQLQMVSDKRSVEHHYELQASNMDMLHTQARVKNRLRIN